MAIKDGFRELRKGFDNHGMIGKAAIVYGMMAVVIAVAYVAITIVAILVAALCIYGLFYRLPFVLYKEYDKEKYSAAIDKFKKRTAFLRKHAKLLGTLTILVIALTYTHNSIYKAYPFFRTFDNLFGLNIQTEAFSVFWIFILICKPFAYAFTIWFLISFSIFYIGAVKSVFAFNFLAYENKSFVFKVIFTIGTIIKEMFYVPVKSLILYNKKLDLKIAREERLKKQKEKNLKTNYRNRKFQQENSANSQRQSRRTMR